MNRHQLNEEIVDTLSRLTNIGYGSNDDLIDDLIDLTKDGVSEKTIMVILDLIFDTTSSSIKLEDKINLLENCLKPNENLSSDVFFKVNSTIGISQIYYKNNQKFQNKKLPQQFQLQVLDWVIDNFDFFKPSIIKSGSFALTILIKHLSFEFARFQISKIIILTLSDNDKIITSFRNKEVFYKIEILQSWHIKQVVELFIKFPLDIYLRELLSFFKFIKPELDYIIYSKEYYKTLNRLGNGLKHVYGWDDEFQNDRIKRSRPNRVTSRDLGNTSDGSLLIQNLVNRSRSDKLNPYLVFRSSLKDVKKTKVLILLILSNANFKAKLNKYIEVNLENSSINEPDETEKFTNQLEYLLEVIQNSYIMDAVNSLWRNKFLNVDTSNSNSPHKAFYLNADFLNQVKSIYIFDNNEYLNFEKLGEVFINPSLSCLSTKLIRKFEDAKIATITMRLEGPPSKAKIESIFNNKDDSEVKWLNLNYDGLKLKVLQEIDLFGFHGLGNLLFTSLKTLSGKRVVGGDQQVKKIQNMLRSNK
ncbi:unnamed protein product [Candida verbasci]|uniref:Uncharacterized protein n=1 Tax=Candida verbasci TaxID=1227364 RepID=A0A9W4U331_9ASCO|nr:unnamed protein product [Candida verbasci]